MKCVHNTVTKKLKSTQTQIVVFTPTETQLPHNLLTVAALNFTLYISSLSCVIKHPLHIVIILLVCRINLITKNLLGHLQCMTILFKHLRMKHTLLSRSLLATLLMPAFLGLLILVHLLIVGVFVRAANFSNRLAFSIISLAIYRVAAMSLNNLEIHCYMNDRNASSSLPINCKSADLNSLENNYAIL